MSSKALEEGHPRRTSERRRLKMLRKLNEYKIANPYSTQTQVQTLPHEISSQLKKLTHLSTTSIEMLSFDKGNLENSNPDSLLLKMKQASMSQEERYESLYGREEPMLIENPEQVQAEECQSAIAANADQRDQVMSTHEDRSMHLHPFHNNLLDYREIYDEELNFLESRPNNSFNELTAFKDQEMVIIDEEYEHYFVN